MPLTNDDFRAFLKRKADVPAPPPSVAATTPGADASGFKPVAKFTDQTMAADAVRESSLQGTALRRTGALSRVPRERRGAVFACACETLKVLDRLRNVLSGSALVLADDLTRPLAPAVGDTRVNALPLSLACVLLHDLIDGRWLDPTRREVRLLLSERGRLVARYTASGTGSTQAAGTDATADGYLVFARVNLLRGTVDDAVAALAADGWRELRSPLGVAPATIPDGGRWVPPLLSGEAAPRSDMDDATVAAAALSAALPADVPGGRDGPTTAAGGGGGRGDDCPQQGAIAGGAAAGIATWLGGGSAKRFRRDSDKRFCRDALLPDVLAFAAGTSRALSRHPLIASGVLLLQDRASCAVAHVLSPRPGGRVVDACAAPGKKSAHVAALAGGACRVLAVDSDGARVRRMGRLLDSLGATSCVVPVQADFLGLDAAAPLGDSQWGRAEAIVLDPSCSGSGTTFFHDGGGGGGEGGDEGGGGAGGGGEGGGGSGGGGGEGGSESVGTGGTTGEGGGDGDGNDHGKGGSSGCAGSTGGVGSIVGSVGGGRRRPTSPSSFGRMQLRLLLRAMAWTDVRTIVYSTCSVCDEENEGVVAAALSWLGSNASCGKWRLTEAMPAWPHRGRAVCGLAPADAQQLMRFDPTRDLCLGFFIARFDREP